MLTALSFSVDGLPQTKGSWRPGRNRRTGRVVLRPDNPGEESWALQVGWAARRAMRSPPMPDKRQYRASLRFWLPEPHGRKGRRDLDKLARSCLDALQGIIWADDEQVVELHLYKGVTTGQTGMVACIEAIDCIVAGR